MLDHAVRAEIARLIAEGMPRREAMRASLTRYCSDGSDYEVIAGGLVGIAVRLHGVGRAARRLAGASRNAEIDNVPPGTAAEAVTALLESAQQTMNAVCSVC